MSLAVKCRPHCVGIRRPAPDPVTRLDKLRLDKNERISPFPELFWQQALAGISQEMVQACPETWPLYERLSRHHVLPPEQFLLTAGSEIAIRTCFEAFVAPGDKVFFPQPTFAMVPLYADLYQADSRPLRYDQTLTLPIGELIAGLDERTSLVVLANPNSPTGGRIADQSLLALLVRAAELRIPVLVDEAYYGFCPHSAIGLLQEFPNLIISRSFSKMAGMAGIRAGYAVASAELIKLLTSFRPMYELNAVGIHLACAMLDQWQYAEQYVRETIAGREQLAAWLEERQFSVLRTETNFLHVDFGAVRDEIKAALAGQGVLVRGMLDIPGYDQYTRISVGPWEAMTPLVETISRCGVICG